MLRKFILNEYKIIEKHLKEVNMTYYEHLRHSLNFSKVFMDASYKAYIHAILPSKYQTTSTDLTRKLNEIVKIQNDKNKK